MPQGRRAPQRAPREPGGGAERPPRKRSDLLSRILVAIPAAIVAIAFIDIGGLAFAIFMIAVGCVCLSELYGLLHRWRPVDVVGYAALAAMVLGARYGSLRDVTEVALAAVPILFLAVLARGNAGGATVAIAGTLLGVYWVGFAFAHAELARELPVHGKSLVLDIAVGTFLGDTGAYIGGRLFGRMPLAPSVSPNKTVEGLFCGGLIAILSVYLAAENSSLWLTHGDALLLGLMIAILGPIGDLFESLVKRDAGAKDAGRLFGAHGGALDRLDGVMFTIVGAYYIYLALGIH
jgi:phosphatidate cytidylyltransferase